MKKLPSVKAVMALITIIIVTFSANQTSGNIGASNKTIITEPYILSSKVNTANLSKQIPEEIDIVVPVEMLEKTAPKEEKKEIVYDNLTIDELAQKLDKNLKSTLSGYGMVFAESALKYQVDPYLALAIVLHETGCGFGRCSTLASKCNNIGGMKGTPGCGGAYKKFNTLNEGIEAFFQNLSKNYYQKGLTTPETIGKKYAESTTWPQKIHYYMELIRNS